MIDFLKFEMKVFYLLNLEVYGNVMKYGFDCLIYLFNWNEVKVGNEEIKL